MAVAELFRRVGLAEPPISQKSGQREVSNRRVEIIGGGLAGLLAAIELSKNGIEVAVLEAAGQFGGRARTRDVDGFLFNRGPHALYCNGALKRELDRLGIPYSGGRSLSGARQAIAVGKLHHLPTTLGSIVRTSLFSVRDKISYTRIFKTVMDGATGSGSFADWLDEQRVSPMVRSAVEAMGRLSSYVNGAADVSARALLDQIRLTTAGTIYVDGGWVSLVNGLIEAARASGVELNDKAPVAKVNCATGRLELVLGNGETRKADAVIMAIDPKAAAALVPEVTSLAREAREVRTVRANSGCGACRRKKTTSHLESTRLVSRP
ncbi:MAG: FAD-dependent oxidoreductase [Rhizobiales bacterium]|nr:FAD-dependent oxidoreductase [Hyphomicrobiales bacterium]